MAYLYLIIKIASYSLVILTCLNVKALTLMEVKQLFAQMVSMFMFLTKIERISKIKVIQILINPKMKEKKALQSKDD